MGSPKLKLEKEIQKEIMDYLSFLNLFYFRCNNAQAYKGRNHHSASAPSGLPDIFVLCNGELYALEVKQPGKPLLASQEDMKNRLLAHGAHYYTVTSIEDVKNISVLFQ